MLRVLETLLLYHDLRLVLLAAAICVFGATATINVSSRVAGTRHAFLWLMLVSLCAGATVWSTHFIAMLAYMTDMPMTYDPGLTGLSLASGAVLMGMGFTVAIRRAGTRNPALLGGAIVGAGVIVLHYVGMAAVHLPGGRVTYAPNLVAASVLLSLIFGAMALASTFGRPRANAKLLGVLLMVLMIVALHFTAMGAVIVDHGVASDSSAGVSRSVLATAVAVASLSVLIIGLTGAIVDQKVSHRLAAEADRFRALSEGAFEGLVVHRNGVIVDANAAARRMFGLEEGLAHHTIHSWFSGNRGEHPWHVGAHEEPIETLLRTPGGLDFPAEICRRRILLSDGAEAELLAVRDLTVRKESEARIAHLALHDVLTDLPNRRFFMEMAQKAISLAERPGTRFALLALDLDNFKVVNDVHGHAAGDELLRITAARINAVLRAAADFSGRFGGDEFAILQSNASSAANTSALAERLLDALHAPIEVHGAHVTVSVSIGIALFPDDGATVEELLRNADTAMYRAKSDGKATFRFFELTNGCCIGGAS